MEIKKITTKTIAEHVADGYRFDVTITSDGADLIQVQASAYDTEAGAYAGSFNWQQGSGASLSVQNIDAFQAVSAQVPIIMDACRAQAAASEQANG